MSVGEKNTLSLRVLVSMVTGITDENGWQEIHQVTNTHTLTQRSTDDGFCSVLIVCVGVFWCLCACSGMSLWQRAALGAPPVLRRQHEFPERLRKHCAAPVCPVQPGNQTHGRAGHMSDTLTAFTWLVSVLQDSCARVLLFRGANKDIKNYNNQTAFQVRKDKNWEE